MSESRVDFSSMPWEESGHGARSKSVSRDGKKLRLIEFTREFIEHDWCRKGHVGDVLEGEMEMFYLSLPSSKTV